MLLVENILNPSGGSTGSPWAGQVRGASPEYSPRAGRMGQRQVATDP